MTNDRETIGLACAGGVVEGAFYEIGALCALEEAIEGISFHALDVYIGVSAGALITSCLANGIPAHELSRAVVSDATAPELNIEPDILFTPAWEAYSQGVRRLPEVVTETLQRYARQPGDLSVMALLTDLGQLMPAGLFSNNALETYLRHVLQQAGRTNDFRKLNTILRIVAVHLDTADLVIFGDPDTAAVPISKAVQASTALPGLYQPVEIDGERYIDGVTRRTVHASQALDAGTSLLFCINPIVPVDTRGDDIAHGVHLAEKGLTAVLSQTLRTLVYSRMQTGFKKYAHTHPDADILLIEPRMDDHRIFFSNIFSFSNRKEICEHAYQSTRAYLRNNADTLHPLLKRHGLSLRTDILSDSTRALYPLPLPTVTAQTQTTLDRLDVLLDQLMGAAE